eukprot:TRINITY_DN2082_c0_g1_i2.p1 TRINITY_DN2082_c0_g1~~TRINITY_DN2082_c0_g1_i2.p1  ORF type:complete len:1494 (-),score=288.02 TRINITY_DN2082_c0_g1_i2:3342-7799(-)
MGIDSAMHGAPHSPKSPRKMSRAASLSRQGTTNLFQWLHRADSSSSGDMRSAQSALSKDVPFIKTLLPRALLRRVRSGQVTDAANAFPFDGAILFADISGFTPLSEALCAKGPSGVEALQAVLNAYFERILATIILDFEGDVIAFAGDALIAVWRAKETRSMLQCVLQASNCALRCCGIQKKEKFQAEGNALTLHCAIACGELYGIQCGGVSDKWQFLLCGDPLGVQLAQISDLAKSGETVLSSEAHTIIRDSCRGTLLRDGSFLLCSVRPHSTLSGSKSSLKSLLRDSVNDHPDEAQMSNLSIRIPKPLSSGRDSVEDIKKFIPTIIMEQAKAGLTEWIGSLQRCSILFISLPGILFKSVSDLSHLQTALQHIQTVAQQNEGYLRQILVDDKGCVAILIFGLPPCTHQEYPSLAVMSALSLKTRLDQEKIQSSMGVTTGKVFCGVIGSSIRRDYAVVGDVVNLSARLMVASHGSILCDKETMTSSSSVVTFDALPPIKVKGKSYPIDVFRPLRYVRPTSRKENAVCNQILIKGRVDEQQSINTFLDRLDTTDSVKVMVFTGESGIGKTVLIDAADELAAQKEISRFSVLAEYVERNTPFAVWQALLQAMTSDLLPSYISPNQLVPFLERILKDKDIVSPYRLTIEDLLDRLPLLGDLYGITFPPTKWSLDISTAARFESTQEMIVHVLLGLIKRLPRAKMLLLIDNSQWMDSHSWKLLSEVTEHIKSVWMIVAYRHCGSESPSYVREFIDTPERQVIRLNGVDGDTAVEIAAAVLRKKPDQLGPSLCQMLRERSNGNPLMIEELAVGLLHSGALEKREEAYELRLNPASGVQMSWSQSLESMIISRIEQLPPHPCFAIKVASVIGRIFDFETMYEVFPAIIDRTDLENMLNACVEAGVLVLANGSYEFRNSLFMEVSYSLLLTSQKKKIHLSVGEYLEKRFSKIDGYASILANHFYVAEEYEKAFDYYFNAAMFAHKTYANEEVIRTLSLALGLYDKRLLHLHPRRVSAAEGYLGEAYNNVGAFQKAKQYFERCLNHLGYRPPRYIATKLLSIGVHIAVRFFITCRPRQERGWDEELHEEHDQETAARVLMLLQECHYFEADILSLVSGLVQIMNLCESASLSSFLPEVYCKAACLMILAKAPSHWAEYYIRMSLRFIGTMRPEELVGYRLFHGLYCALTGNGKQALHLVDEGMHISRRLGDHRKVGMLKALAWETHALYGSLSQMRAITKDDDLCSVKRTDRFSTIWKSNWRMYQAIKYGCEQAADVAVAMEACRSGAFCLSQIESANARVLCACLRNDIEEVIETLDSLNRDQISSLSIVFSYEIGMMFLLHTHRTIVAEGRHHAPSNNRITRHKMWRTYCRCVSQLVSGCKHLPLVRPLALYFMFHQQLDSIGLCEITAQTLASAYARAQENEQRGWCAIILSERAKHFPQQKISGIMTTGSVTAPPEFDDATESLSVSQKIFHSLAIDPQLLFATMNKSL